ncbi:TetR/AcrR family transcriptional regulator [Chitinivorax sp. B]|uniref:TetR/AcrR family transcriptional regulator n=1 Tax=Chitinivorax sp. B TaxID=2502235 RepID=UPI0010F83D22|nr:TetR/AcrR family transcriptional regulator [Chitinivorax sp. B]
MVRTTDVDWLVLGYSLLREQGHTALTIDTLCQIAGRTKGSFYHHHGSMQGFKQALLDKWRADHTDRLINETNAYAQPAKRRQVLDSLALQLDARLECAIRNWAAHDPLALEAMQQVDTQRIDYAARLHQEEHQCTADEALRIALAGYAMYVGFLQLTGEREQRILREWGPRARIVFVDDNQTL